MADQQEFTRRQRVLSEFGDFVLDHDDLDSILNEGCHLNAINDAFAIAQDKAGTGAIFVALTL